MDLRPVVTMDGPHLTLSSNTLPTHHVTLPMCTLGGRGEIPPEHSVVSGSGDNEVESARSSPHNVIVASSPLYHIDLLEICPRGNLLYFHIHS